MKAGRERRTLGTIPFLIAVYLIVLPAQAKYGGGTGTADDPYQIWTAEQMNAIGTEPNDWDKHFQLMADIDLSAYDGQEGRPAFNLIAPGTDTSEWDVHVAPFSGIFDGNGHTILSFNYHYRDRRYVGLFGRVAGSGAEIRNLRLIDLIVESEGGWFVGGLVGYNEGTVADCHASGRVSGQYNVGGLVGANAGVMTRGHFSGDVSGTGNVGGLAGRSGESNGGVTSCYSMGTVSGEEGSIGGLIGENCGDVTGCYSAAAAHGHLAIGGLVGRNDGASITHCYSTGAVSGTYEYVGGLVGYNNSGVVTCCYSTGAVGGKWEYTGGLVGLPWVGWSGGGTVGDCLWDVRTSGQAKSDGGIGRTTAQMHDIRTYLDAGWDFVGETKNGTCEIWQMLPGGDSPVLAALNGYTPRELHGTGTPEDPYLISDVLELGAIVHYPREAHYRLAASIDLSGIRWATGVVPRFAGGFDGNGMTISHLTVTSGRHVGLFGRLESAAQVEDLGIVDVNITGSEDYVGALAGDNAGTVVRCNSSGVVGSDGDCIGGLVGRSTGDVLDCHSVGAVGGTGWGVGGLVGKVDVGRVTSCDYVGTVNWHGQAGGQGPVGGLVGWNRDGTISQCYSKGTVRSIGKYVGGLVGNNSGDVVGCYSADAVCGTGQEAGGLVGVNFGILTCCYSTGVVSGTGEYVGGLVGCGWGRLRSREGPGEVIVGIVTDCFWDIQTSGQSLSAGGVGKTTAEMQTASTFLDAGWDFVGETGNGTGDIWWMEEGKGYPRLWWEAQD